MLWLNIIGVSESYEGEVQVSRWDLAKNTSEELGALLTHTMAGLDQNASFLGHCSCTVHFFLKVSSCWDEPLIIENKTVIINGNKIMSANTPLITQDGVISMPKYIALFHGTNNIYVSGVD